MQMQESELEIGDIIFFTDSFGNPEHVAVYNGKQGETHFVTHGVTGKYHSIMTTRLTANDKEEEGDMPYHVFRPATLELGIAIAHRMRVWGTHNIPFSKEKHELYSEIIDRRDCARPGMPGLLAQQQLAEKYFSPNFYQLIEIASHPTSPYFPHLEEHNIEGMYCSEALTAAINVEYLLSMHAVKSCNDLNLAWISDNTDQEMIEQYAAALPQEFKPGQEYADYIQRHHSQTPYEELHTQLSFNSRKVLEKFPPSFIAWNYPVYGSIEKFAKQSGSPLPLDPTLATPGAMFAYMCNHPEMWNDMGHVTIQNREYPFEKLEADKTVWRKYVTNLFESGQKNKEHLRNRCAELEDLDLQDLGRTFRDALNLRASSLRASDDMLLTKRPNQEDYMKLHAERRTLLFASPLKNRQEENKPYKKDPLLFDPARNPARKKLAF